MTRAIIAPQVVLDAGKEGLFVRGPSPRPLRLTGQLALGARACVGAGTLEECFVRIVNSGEFTPREAELAVSRLTELRVFVPVAALRDGCESTRPAPIQAVGVPTADRPQRLWRSVSDAMQGCQRFGRSVTLIVVDGSRTERGAEETKLIVRKARAEFKDGRLIYVGRDSRRRLSAHLVSRGVDPAVTEFALEGATCGSGRNVLLSLCAGKPLLMLDDDIRWRTWRPPNQCLTDIRVAGHGAPFEERFFTTRNEATSSVQYVTQDVLALHEGLLGRRVSDVLASFRAVDMSRACEHMSRLVKAQSNVSDVRVTMLGLAGDSAVNCPYRRLFRPSVGTLSTQQITDDEWRRSFESRETTRVVSHVTVGHELGCMGYCLGVASSAMVPPFLPVERNEDGLWAAMLGAVEPLTVVGHIPWGVVHDSTRTSRRSRREISSADETRLADLIGAMVRDAVPRRAEESLEQRFMRMSQRLSDMAELTPRAFEEYVVDLVLRVRHNELIHLDRLLATSRSEEVRRAADFYRQRLLRGLAAAKVYRPTTNRVQGAETLRHAQVFVGLSARLIAWWPAIWTHCREVDEQARVELVM